MNHRTVMEEMWHDLSTGIACIPWLSMDNLGTFITSIKKPPCSLRGDTTAISVQAWLHWLRSSSHRSYRIRFLLCRTSGCVWAVCLFLLRYGKNSHPLKFYRLLGRFSWGFWYVTDARGTNWITGRENSKWVKIDTRRMRLFPSSGYGAKRCFKVFEIFW